MKGHSVVLGKAVCGVVLLTLAVAVSFLDPVSWITRYMMRFEDGSLVYRVFQRPDYMVHQTIYIYNYTNTDRYIQGLDRKLKVEEIGPFVYQEVTEGLNMSVDHERHVVRVTPKASLVAIPELSVANPRDVRVVVPNLVMIVLGTLAADTLPSWSNSLVAFLMRSVGSQPFNQLTAEDILWGYQDPLVDIAGSYFPGWIDFSTVGIMKMFYSTKLREMELEAEGESQFSIRSWYGSPGLTEQSYDGPGSENNCNTIRGSYQAIMLSPGYNRSKLLNLFKYQGCRVYPFSYERQGLSDIGVSYDRYVQRSDTYNASGEFSCRCRSICPPDGLTDISRCYYGFPVYLSPPHFYEGDPSLLEYLEGLSPEEERAKSYIDFDPVTGIPLALCTNTQTNLRVNVSPYNAAMAPFGRVRYLPVLWFRMSTPEGPTGGVITNLKLRHIYGPYSVVAAQILLAVGGALLLGSGMLYLLRSYRREREERRREAEGGATEPLNKKIKLVN